FAYSSSLRPSSAKGCTWSGVAAAFSTVSDSGVEPCGVEGVFSAVIAGSGPFVTRAGGPAGRRPGTVPPVYERGALGGPPAQEVRPRVRPRRHQSAADGVAAPSAGFVGRACLVQRFAVFPALAAFAAFSAARRACFSRSRSTFS